MLEPYELGDRGFHGFRFADHNGHACSLQESILATEAAVWFGVNAPEVKTCRPGVGWKDVTLPPDASVVSRMHLTQEMVRGLLPALEHFAEHGELPHPEPVQSIRIGDMVLSGRGVDRIDPESVVVTDGQITYRLKPNGEEGVVYGRIEKPTA